MIRVNGQNARRAFIRVAGSWVEMDDTAKGIFGRVGGVWVKAWPFVPPAPPITGASISPTSRTWTENGPSDFRASFTGSTTGGTGPFVFNWSANAGAAILSGQGTANVVVRSPTGAAATVSLFVDDQGSGTQATATPRPINAIPVVVPLSASISPASRTWSGALGSFTASFAGSGSGGSGSYGYSWSVTGGTIQSGQGTANVTVASANGVAASVTLTLSDTVLGTSTTASASVAAVVWPTLTATVAPTSLSGTRTISPVITSESATVSVTGGSGSWTVQWGPVGSAGEIGPTNGIAATTPFQSVGTQDPGTTRTATFRAYVTDTVTGLQASSNTVAITLVRPAAALVVSATPSSLSGSSTADQVETTGAATVGVTGGSGTWTVQWLAAPGGTGGFSPVSPTATSTRFRAATGQARGTTLTGSYFPRVTDTVTGLTADGPSVSVSLTRQYLPMTVSVTPSALSGASTSAPVQTAGSATASVTGGSGTFTYAWASDGTGTGGLSPVTPTAASSAFVSTGSQAAGSTLTSGFRITVTDTVTGLSVTSTPSVSVVLTRNYLALSASLTPSTLSGIGNGTPIVTSGSATATASGGSGSYTYAWEWDGGASTGSAIVASNPTNRTTTFQSGDTHAAGWTRSRGMRCRVTDTVTGGSVVTNSVVVTLTRYAPLEASATPVSLSATSLSTPVVTGAATATASGGSGTYTYAWEINGTATGGPILANSPTNRVSTFQSSGTQNPGNVRSANFRCRVTDTVTGASVFSNNVGVTLTRTALSGQIVPGVGDWSGSFPNYNASFSVTSLNGSGSYTFLWQAPGTTIQSGQGTSTVQLRSASGGGTTVTCTVSDTVTGQDLVLEATLNSVSGGGGV